MTLGPAEAADQLRDAMAIGVDRAMHLETDGSDWDPVATAAALIAAIRDLEAAPAPFDLILFGNESADIGRVPGGIRVATALDRPIVTGAKGLEIGDGPRRSGVRRGWLGGLRRAAAGGRRASTRGSTCRATRRCRAACGRRRRRSSGSRPPVARAARSSSACASRSSRSGTAEILGTGPEAAPRVVEVLRQIGCPVSAVVVLVEHARRRARIGSALETLASAARLGGELGAPVHVVLSARVPRRRPRLCRRRRRHRPCRRAPAAGRLRARWLGGEPRRGHDERGRRRRRGARHRARHRGPGASRGAGRPADGGQRRRRHGRRSLAGHPPALGRQPARGSLAGRRRRA